jgi:hypothetical protein
MKMKLKAVNTAQIELLQYMNWLENSGRLTFEERGKLSDFISALENELISFKRSK